MPKQTPGDLLAAIWLLAAPLFLLLAAALLGGCTTHTATTVTVGESLILPRISTSDGTSLDLYASIKGARITASTNATLAIAYHTAHTNHYFGIVHTSETLHLNLNITP